MRPAAWIVCALLLLPARALVAAPAWEAPAFSADPKQLAAEAQALPVPEKADFELLSDEVTISFDAQGRRTSTSRMVTRVITPRGAKAQASVERVFAPWHQERPEVRARVVTREGKAFELDQRTLSEGPAGDDEDRENYVDLRRLRAPLPAVAPGAILEVQTTVREHQPFFAAGFTGRYYLAASVPVHRTVVRIEAPKTLPLKAIVRGRQEQPVRSVVGDRQLYTLTLGPLDALEEPEQRQPLDAAPWPFIAYSTGESWSRVAQAYGEIVDRQIAQAPPEALQKVAGESHAQTAARLLARIQKDLRYEGMELGEGALVPRAPAEVLTRGYGDCKDFATLLVAWLRAQGVAANVALVRAGSDDVVDLPGLGEFTHAIVQVPGSPVLWVDPTDPDTVVGKLPVGDAGRLALVAARGSTQLVRLPAAKGQDNSIVVTREFQLAESGAAHVVETRQSAGWPAASLRAWVRAHTPAQQKESYAGYVKQHYETDALDSLQMPASDDMREPLTMRLELGGAHLGWTGREDASVRLKPFAMLFSLLPAALLPPDAGDDDEDPPPADPRKTSLFVELPHQVEVRYRVVPPVGFRGRPLPEDQSDTWGPARFSRRYERAPDGTVTAAFRFETGDGLYSPQDVDAVRQGIEAFGREDQVEVAFESIAEAQMQAGQVREAIAQQLALVKLHPQEALHQQELAQTLLRAGLGEAARQAAQRAVQLAPKSDEAHEMLGWVLEHDLLGRPLGRGFDHAGSVAAYRTARQLAPSRPDLRAALARMLALTPEGKPLDSGSAVDEAISEYQSIARELKNHEHDEALLELLARTERIAQVEQTARQASESPNRTALLLAAIAVRAGVPAAETEAARLVASTEARHNALRKAMEPLTRWRRYDLCRQLLQDLTRTRQEADAMRSLLALLTAVRRHEEVPVSATDPAVPVRKLVQLLLEGKLDPASARELFVEQPSQAELDEVIGALDRTTMRDNTIPRGFLVDVTLAFTHVTSDAGDDALGRRLQADFTFEGEHTTARFYESRAADGTWRIAGSENAPSTLGQEALRRLARGDQAGAVRWLDWAAELTREKPLGRWRLFQALWSPDGNHAGDDPRAAAAALAVVDTSSAEAVAALAQARQGRAPGPLTVLFDETLAFAFARLHRYDEALAAARSLAQGQPDSDSPVVLQAQLLRESDRLADAIRLVQDARQRRPESLALTEEAARLASRAGDFEQAERLGRALVTQGHAAPSTYNNLAWNELLRTGGSDKALADAQQAVKLSRRTSRSALHTLAMVQAERDQPAEALRTLLEGIALKVPPAPDADDWLVVARIAESYGLGDVARTLYERVQPGSPHTADDSSVLAARRLQKLAPTVPAR